MEGLIEYGYIGLFAGAFMAATIFPFSSDILLVAMLAAGGQPVTTIVVATAGNWLGGLTSYGVGISRQNRVVGAVVPHKTRNGLPLPKSASSAGAHGSRC